MVRVNIALRITIGQISREDEFRLTRHWPESHPARAFSLIELVIVVVIIGILAAIAIPRMSRGAEGAAQGGLDSDLAVLRNAIDIYAVEHLSTFPALATFEAQIMRYTDAAGGTSATKDATHIYGPYLLCAESHHCR